MEYCAKIITDYVDYTLDGFIPLIRIKNVSRFSKVFCTW